MSENAERMGVIHYVRGWAKSDLDLRSSYSTSTTILLKNRFLPTPHW